MSRNKKIQRVMVLILSIIMAVGMTPLSWAEEREEVPFDESGDITIFEEEFVEEFDGSGLEMDPYLIKTDEDLYELAELVNTGNDFSGKYFILTNHISLAAYGEDYDEGKGWTPIGTEENPFKGIFDGCGYKITNLEIHRYAEFQGLFGNVLEGTIKKLAVIDANVSGNNYVGLIVGAMENTTVQNCYSTGSVNGYKHVGGVAGAVMEGSKVENCYSTSLLIGDDHVGGVAGTVNGTVTNSAGLNPSIISSTTKMGRIAGSAVSGSLLDNVGFGGMIVLVVGSSKALVTGGNQVDGSTKTATEINAENFFQGLFLNKTGPDPWTYAKGKLPGFGASVDMPHHLRPSGVKPFEGLGHSDSPYLIKTIIDMTTLATLVNTGNPHYSSAYYRLENNLDLSSHGQWTSIGTKENPFKGIFNGNNKIISNLYIERRANYQGLFGYIDTGSKVQNLGVENVNIDGADEVGGIAGHVNGTVERCYSTGSVKGSSGVGGIAGFLDGTIINCYSTSSLIGLRQMGGIAGVNYLGTIKNCYSTSFVQGGFQDYYGGIAGYGPNKIVNCAALNQHILVAPSSKHVGRVTGVEIPRVANCVAYSDMLLNGINKISGGSRTDINGEGKTAVEINAKGFFEDLFGNDPAWTYEEGKLPGFGRTVDMPDYLRLLGGEDPVGGSPDSGSDGSDRSSSTPPAQPTTIIADTKAGEPVTAVASIMALTETKGVARISVSDDIITNTIAKAQAHAQKIGETDKGIGVEFNLTMPRDANSLIVSLGEDSLNRLINAGVSSLKVSGSPVNLNFNHMALQAIQEQSADDVTIEMKPVQNLSKDAQAIIGARPVYDITLRYIRAGQTGMVTTLDNGVATIAIPYTPDKSEALGYLYGVYVDSNGKASRIQGSAYDTGTGTIRISTEHLSVFGVGYTAPSTEFSDVRNHWAKESIEYVLGRGIFSGVSNTAFAPDMAMTRGMLITTLGRLANVDEKDYSFHSFTDVAKDKYYAPYIEWAYKTGTVQGVGSQQFAPDRPITREEIAVILANYAKMSNNTLPAIQEVTAYEDEDGIGPYYKTAVLFMQQAGIMIGDDHKRFNPKASATRAEVSAMLHRYMK